MPKSKRDKKISLTKTSKKGLALKQKIIEDVQKCVEKFSSIYVFTYINMRNEKLKQVRDEWKPSKFFFGKNKVIKIALGHKKEDEIQNDLHKLSNCLNGQCGMLFTNNKRKFVKEWFQNFSCEEFARSGYKVDVTIDLKEGPLENFSHAIEPYLRQLGLPTKLDKGVVTLIKDYRVCKKGNILTPEQAKILELLGYKLATFKFILKACWIKDKGFKKLLIEEEEQEEVKEEIEENKNKDDEMSVNED